MSSNKRWLKRLGVALAVLLVFGFVGYMQTRPVNKPSDELFAQIERLSNNPQALIRVLEQCGYVPMSTGSYTNPCENDGECPEEGEHTSLRIVIPDIPAQYDALAESARGTKLYFENRSEPDDTSAYPYRSVLFSKFGKAIFGFASESAKKKCSCIADELQRLISTAEALGVMPAE